MLKQTITICGNPYSGVTYAGKYLSQKYGLACKSYHYPINSIYNDLSTIFKFTGYQRYLQKMDLMLKHSAIMERTLGTPIDDNAKYVFKWMQMIEREDKELFVKTLISEDLFSLSSDWRKRILTEDIEHIYCSGIILTHPFNLEEFEFKANTLCLWINTPRWKCYQNCFNKNEEYENKIFNREYLANLRTLKHKSDFMVNNVEDKLQFQNELDKLMKEVLRFEEARKY